MTGYRNTAAYESDLSMVQEFVSQGMEHGTLTEAILEALREVREGTSITLALDLAKEEWYK